MGIIPLISGVLVDYISAYLGCFVHFFLDNCKTVFNSFGFFLQVTNMMRLHIMLAYYLYFW